MPVPTCIATVKGIELPPTQKVCVVVGCVAMMGSGKITIAPGVELILEHPPVL